jgi:hypothetical protein
MSGLALGLAAGSFVPRGALVGADDLLVRASHSPPRSWPRVFVGHGVLTIFTIDVASIVIGVK